MTGITPSAAALWAQRTSFEGKSMTGLIGALTLAGTVLSIALGQVSAGAEALGVVIAAVTLMTVRA
jgi:hypothetical protein